MKNDYNWVKCLDCINSIPYKGHYKHLTECKLTRLQVNINPLRICRNHRGMQE